MPILTFFAPRHLVAAIKCASFLPLLFISNAVLGATITVNGRVLNVDASNNADTYLVTNNGTLNINGGTQHVGVTNTASTVNMGPGSAIGRMSLLGGATITMNDAAVTQGLIINNSNGVLANSTVSNAGIGMLVNRNSNTTTGSLVSMTDSTSTGGLAGALVTHFSELNLLRSDLIGTGVNGLGLRLNAGVARATDSSILGALNGIAIGSDEYVGAALTLDGSRVEGQTGAAIVFGPQSPSTPGTEGTIDISNGSTLIGGNGNILEIFGASTAQVTVSNSNLVGSVNVDGASNADLGFAQASLTGNVVVEEASTASLAFIQSTLNGDVQVGGLSTADLDFVGSTLEGNVNFAGASIATVDFAQSFLMGNVLIDEASTAALDFVESSLTGNVVVDETSTAALVFAQSTLTGDVQVGGLSTADLDFFGSSLDGNVSVTGTSTATLDFAESVLTGTVQVDATSTITLGLDQSQMTGDVVVGSGGVANIVLDNDSLLTGRLENTRSVAINNGSRWVMVDNGTLGDLAMNGGSIKFGDPAAFYTLSVANLSGNGTFLMDVDFGGVKTDFLDITGSASGSHSLLIGSTGTDPLNDTRLHVVHAAAGDAAFALVGGAVDLGTWSYDLVKEGSNDWYLDAATRKISPATQTVVALFNTAPTVWYGELSTLRTRMGELRLNGGRSGGWMRTYGNKFNVADASGFGYRQVQQGVSLGADGKLPVGDGQWLAGVVAGQSKSDLELERGSSGKVDSYYVGAYSTWLDSDTGYYFDGVLKFNRFNNKARVNLSDGARTRGDYSNSGVGASLEFGRHIKLDDHYFVEPYSQLAGVIIQGKDFDLDNGMRAEGGRTRSLLGKVGATVGRNFDLGQGRTVQPYVRAALAHEFAKNNQVQVNDNVFNNDLSGSRGEAGAGIAVALSDRFELHTDVEYSKGNKIEQPWGANIGVRYNW